jgi:predicted dehydrogenase
MKQAYQSLKTGIIELADSAVPRAGCHSLLLQSRSSLISLGTERMLVSFGQANLLQKAKQQPDKVKQVIEKVKTDGLAPTMQSVFARLDEPLPLGYSNAGVVLEFGEGVSGFAPGDRVVSNGPHAEVVSVSQNLAAKIPDGVSFEEAAFTVVASIGLQGLRLAEPTLGETVVVIGLGLIGQLTMQLAKAHGCRVIGTDIDDSKRKLAERFGVETLDAARPVVDQVMAKTNGVGADAVLITASSSSNDIMHQAAQMSRKRGRIILVGVVGLELSRADFYEKELTFRVSCSYGPGRYDPSYEQKARDYPLPYVRWTEQRNFEAVLACMARGALNVKPLISEIVAFDKAPEVYAKLTESQSIATLLRYPEQVAMERTIRTTPPEQIKQGAGKPRIGVIGAGLFTKVTMLPALAKTDASLAYICSQSGGSLPYLAKKFSIAQCTTDSDVIWNDQSVNGVIITTRHNQHAPMVLEGIRAGKHVFVEKPLCLTTDELERIQTAVSEHASANVSVMVGFNRRFSPHTQKIKQLLGDAPGIISGVFTFNAGAIPQDHWTQDPRVGGGRILGEACHFIDLFRHIAASPIREVFAVNAGPEKNPLSDIVMITLKCENGSTAVINYLANGNKRWPKEQIQIYSSGRIVSLNNFRTLEAVGFKKFTKLKTPSQDKGHAAELSMWTRFIQHGGKPPIPFDEIVHSAKATLAAAASLKSGARITVE